MKNKISFVWILLLFTVTQAFSKSNVKTSVQNSYTTTVTFAGNFSVGDYIEFVQLHPIAAGSSGYYQVSIAYTRGNIAAAATHLVSASHANPSLWREAGRINNNDYVGLGQNFTIDCNTVYGIPKLRIRAINNLGVASQELQVTIIVTSLNANIGYTPLNTTGNDVSVDKFLPMTKEWDLYVGNVFTSDGASLAIKAISNGNVGIGTSNPQEKLSVNGKVRAKEVKVEVANWPDYVFEEGYALPSLSDIEKFIKINKHLPEMPASKQVVVEGIELGEMNKLLLKKIEELTLLLIDKDKELKREKSINDQQSIDIKKLYELIAIKK